MGMNLVRGASAGVLGVASGALENQTPLALGGQSIRLSTIVEAVGLVAGAGMPLVAPFTLPNVADGLADGALALLLRRGTVFAISNLGVGAAAHTAARVYGNTSSARGDISGRFQGQNQTALV